jgi:hypothetical protein
MKKLLYLTLIFGALFTAAGAKAQFGSIPGVVTDSFKVKYPSAKSVSWSGKLSSFNATFTLENEKHIAKYNKKGEWQNTTKEISRDAMPSAIKDGLAKSKYANPTEWEVRSVTVRYLPGNITQYLILIAKNDIQKRSLLFSSDGQLMKDGNTL